MRRRVHVLLLAALLLCLCVASYHGVSAQEDGEDGPGTVEAPQDEGDGGGGDEPALVEAEDEPAEGGGGDGKATVPEITLTGEFEMLYSTLEKAAGEGTPWGEIKIAQFSVQDVSQVLAKLVLHITSKPTVATYIKKYKSLGLQLPQKLDLYGLMKANPATPADWGKTVNATAKAVHDKTEYSTSLWSAMAAYADITAMDEKAAKLEDLDEPTRDKYITRCQDYYIESATLSWTNTAVDLVQQIHRIEAVGKHLDHNWLLELASPVDNPTLEDPMLFAELALLQYVPADKIVDFTGAELGGSVVKKYITTGREHVSKGNTAAVNQLYLDPALNDYSLIAQTFCTPGHVLRFCLIKSFADQGAMLAHLDRGLYNTNAITKLPDQAANLDRHKFLKALNKKVQRQVLAFEIVQAFDGMKNSINAAATDLTARSKAVTYETTLQRQEAMTTQMREKAIEYNETASGDLVGSKLTLQTKMDKIDALMKEIGESSPPYLDRVKVIAESALKEAQAKKSRGIFGFIMKILEVFNPINWVTNPGVFVDVLNSGMELRKSTKAVDNAKGMIEIIQNSLLPKFEDILQKMQTLAPKIEAIGKAAQTIVAFNPDGGDREQLNAVSSTFLRAYADYEAPLTMTDIDVLEELFINIQTEMCNMAKKRATEECAQVKQDVMIFDKLGQVFSTAQEALDATADIARSAVAKQSAQMLLGAVEKSAERAAAALNALKDEWDKKAEEAQAKWTRYQRGLEYQQALLALNLLATSVRTTSATLMACNFLTYLNGGVAIPDCLPMYENPSAVQDLKKIIAFEFQTKPEAYNAIAYLPTSPSAPGDTMYLDLERLMADGLNMTFRLPQNEAWLRKYNWIPSNFDMQNNVAFLTKLQILLPPKLLLTKGDETSKQVVTVVARTLLSDLGPAVNNKVYQIPMRQYTFTYEQSASASTSCSAKFTYAYRRCNPQLLPVCPIVDGEVDASSDDVPLPSLFSPFNVYTQFRAKAGKDATQLSYSGARGSAPVAVGISLVIHTLGKDQKRPTKMEVKPLAERRGGGGGDDEDAGAPVEGEDEPAPEEGGDGQGEEEEALPEEEAPPEEGGLRLRRLRFLADEVASPKRCCAVGSYLKDWKSDECAKCPPGFVSQLGGLYCVRPPSARGGEKSGGQGEDEGTPDEAGVGEEEEEQEDPEGDRRRGLRHVQ